MYSSRNKLGIWALVWLFWATPASAKIKCSRHLAGLATAVASIAHRPIAAGLLGAQPDNFYFSHQSNFFQGLGFAFVLESAIRNKAKELPESLQPVARWMERTPGVIPTAVAAAGVYANYFFELSGNYQAYRDWTDFGAGMAGLAAYGLIQKFWPAPPAALKPTED